MLARRNPPGFASTLAERRTCLRPKRASGTIEDNSNAGLVMAKRWMVAGFLGIWLAACGGKGTETADLSQDTNLDGVTDGANLQEVLDQSSNDDGARPDGLGPDSLRPDLLPQDVPGVTDIKPDSAVDLPCVPDCTAKSCGPDGCGGTCGLCTAPKEQCLEGACHCPEGKHDGGSGSCLMAGQCDAGFAIAANSTECKPLYEVCVSPNPCEIAASWALGQCAYTSMPDWTPCQPAAPGPCAVTSQCKSGLCKEVWGPCSPLRPVILVHGVNGSSENFAVMKQRLLQDGWPANYIYSFDAADPEWGCNLDNASAIQALVKQAMDATCQPRVDLVAHSMGTLSSRYFIKNLGGAGLVNTYVTLGGMHHGLLSACFAPDFLGVCVWQEICQWGDFVKQLNEDPATPGPCNWVSIFSTADETISADSSTLEGAENIQFEGVAHDGETGLLQDPSVYAEVKRVLQYPCW